MFTILLADLLMFKMLLAPKGFLIDSDKLKVHNQRIGKYI